MRSASLRSNVKGLVFSLLVAAPVTAMDPGRAMLGVVPADRSSGAVVQDLYVGGPAEAAGLRPGDQIAAVNGTAIATAERLSKIIADEPPSAQVDVLVIRDGWTKHFFIGLANREDVLRLRLGRDIAAESGRRTRVLHQNGYVDAIRARNIMDPYYRAIYTDFR